MTEIHEFKKARINLDPRTKLFFLIIAAFYISIKLSVMTETLVIIIYISPLLMMRYFKWAFSFIIIYAVQLLFSIHLLAQIDSPFFVFILSYLTYGLRILLPSMIAGAYAVKTTAVNEWIAAFKKMHMPNWFLIPLAVMTRFFPTINEDYKHIRKALAFRGIGSSFWDLIKRPIQTIEFILIPLLMNATRIAEDLTISSLTKGLGIDNKYTTITKLKMTSGDWTYIVLATMPLILHVGGII